MILISICLISICFYDIITNNNMLFIGMNSYYEYNSRTLVSKDGTYTPLDVSQSAGLPAWMGPQYYKESGKWIYILFL